MPKRALLVCVQKASGLINADIGRGVSDPYVVIKFAGKQLGKTKIIKNDLNPVFEYTLALPLVGPVEDNGEINFEVFDKDLFSKDDSLGVANVKLAEVALAGPEGLSTKKILRPVRDGMNVSGTIDLLVTIVDNYSGKLSSTVVDLTKL